MIHIRTLVRFRWNPWTAFKRWFWRGGVDVPQGKYKETYVIGTGDVFGVTVWIGYSAFHFYGNCPALAFADALDRACEHIEAHPKACNGNIAIFELDGARQFEVIGRVSALRLVEKIRRIVGKG